MSFADNIKAKIKGVDVEAQLTNLVDEGEQLVKEGVTKAGHLAHDKRDEIDGWLQKATEAISSKTEGKYDEHLTKLRTTLLTGVEKVAAHRESPDEDAAPVGDPIELPPAEHDTPPEAGDGSAAEAGDVSAPEAGDDTAPPAGASGPIP